MAKHPQVANKYECRMGSVEDFFSLATLLGTQMWPNKVATRPIPPSNSNLPFRDGNTPVSPHCSWQSVLQFISTDSIIQVLAGNDAAMPPSLKRLTVRTEGW